MQFSPEPAPATSVRDTIEIGRPDAKDGSDVWQLIGRSGSLDENSLYCNLLQCTHFSETCAIARLAGRPVGWVSGYVMPESPDTYFLWQICVDQDARGRGLAKKLVLDILNRPACLGISHLHTTITADNRASWSLFRSIAATLAASLKEAPHFEKNAHFQGRHDTEYLVRIGPFDRAALKSDGAL